MNFNSNIKKRATIHTSRKQFEDLRIRGIQRIRFDLMGSVRNVATSLLKFEPGASFPTHVHPGGEEFYVLEGTLEDERGGYPSGSYVRCPPRSRHTPRSDTGCLLFLKTWQFAKKDRQYINVDVPAQPARRFKSRPDIVYQDVYGDRREDVRIEHWPANQRIEFFPNNGVEVFVLDGGYMEESVSHRQYSWLRLPPGTPLKGIVADTGARVLIKESHLVHAVPGRPIWDQ